MLQYEQLYMIQLFEHHGINRTQKEVDFLIPFLDSDRRYCLDPSLLRFSTTPALVSWREEIDEFLKLVHHVMKGGDMVKLKRVLNIGEAPDAGLGYCKDGVRGSGMGNEISGQVIKILATNEEFRKRGFMRLEELQWLDKNIGSDRISDLAINILKRHIIKYTQQQAKKYKVPMEEVRVNKVFNPDTLEWISIKAKMPINPKRIVKDALNHHPPLLFLPKEAVKALPLFLSYDEFYGFVDEDYKTGRSKIRKVKSEVVNYTITTPKISEDFIRSREAERESLYRPNFDSGIHKQIALLDKIPSGSQKHADQYRDVVQELISFVFDKDLTFYKKEKRSILGEIRRDLIFQNMAENVIFLNLKNKHTATHIVIDTKNTNKVTAKDVAQISNYLNDDIGRVAFIVSRKKDKRLRNHSYTQLTKHKKVIFFIHDEDLKRWVTDKTRIQHTSGKLHPISDAVKTISNLYSDLVSD